MARTATNHHVLPLFCDDLIASCVDMTPSCFGGYMRILCYAWSRGGVPNNEAACGRIAGGFDAGDWQVIRSRLIVLDEGTATERLSHQRLELERAAVVQLREKKSRAGQEGARRRWEHDTGLAEEWHPHGSAIPVPVAGECDGIGKTMAPNPNPNPYPNSQRINTHTHTARASASPDGGKDAAGWPEFAGRWNGTARAQPWPQDGPPACWSGYAATPGWLDRAALALDRLPGCEYFDDPVALTKFVQWVDRILAGEFDAAKGSTGKRRRQPAGRGL